METKRFHPQPNKQKAPVASWHVSIRSDWINKFKVNSLSENKPTSSRLRLQSISQLWAETCRPQAFCLEAMGVWVYVIYSSPAFQLHPSHPRHINSTAQIWSHDASPYKLINQASQAANNTSTHVCVLRNISQHFSSLSA